MQYPTPRHLTNLLSINTQASNAHELEGKVACECGSEEFEVLFVGKRNEEKQRHFMQVVKLGGRWFLRVGARCVSCRREHLIFDSHFHGWNGYVCTDEQVQRIARPPFQEWRCQQCHSKTHKLTVSILGEDMEHAIGESDDALTEADWFEAFGWLIVETACTSCNLGPCRIVDYETM